MAEFDGKTAPRFLAAARQLYRVAVLMPSWLDSSTKVRLWGGAIFWRMATLRSGE